MVGNVSDAERGRSLRIEPFKQWRADSTRAYLEQALRASGNNVSRAASLTGINRQYLHRLLVKHNLRAKKPGRGRGGNALWRALED